MAYEINPERVYEVYEWALLRGIEILTSPEQVRPMGDHSDLHYVGVTFTSLVEELRHGDDLQAWIDEPIDMYEGMFAFPMRRPVRRSRPVESYLGGIQIRLCVS